MAGLSIGVGRHNQFSGGNASHSKTRIKTGQKEKEKITIVVSDDGKGLPEPFEKLNSDTLGLQLVITLVDQLDGEIKTSDPKGTKYLINFDKVKT